MRHLGQGREMTRGIASRETWLVRLAEGVVLVPASENEHTRCSGELSANPRSLLAGHLVGDRPVPESL